MPNLIAIIEDEEDLLELVEYNLQKEGFDTIGFLTPKNIDKLLIEERVDLIIMDRNLKGFEGSEVVAKLKKEGIEVPVIFLSAKNSQKEIEEGFLRGADDYITKPFNMNELVLRVKALLKRTRSFIDTEIKYRDIVMNPKSREVFVDKDYVELTKLEFDLLEAFIKNKNSVLNREFLLENVWEDEATFQEKTVNVAINRLKKKIDPNKTKNYIKSIWGVGYTLC